MAKSYPRSSPSGFLSVRSRHGQFLTLPGGCHVPSGLTTTVEHLLTQGVLPLLFRINILITVAISSGNSIPFHSVLEAMCQEKGMCSSLSSARQLTNYGLGACLLPDRQSSTSSFWEGCAKCRTCV